MKDVFFFSINFKKNKILVVKKVNPINRLSGHMLKLLKIGDRKINPTRIRRYLISNCWSLNLSFKM